VITVGGHVFVFRGRRGDLVKLLWWDGDGLCLFAKRLERELRFPAVRCKSSRHHRFPSRRYEADA